MSVDPVSLAITAGLMALQTAITASQEFEGPRLDSLDVSLADPGTGVPRFWGMVRIDGCPYIWAEKLREKKETQKTKGGKYTNYKYFGTWACLITDQGTATSPAVDAVTKIWFDKHLVFQSRDIGPRAPVMGVIDGPFGFDVKLAWTRNLRIYEGTDDQVVDPRIEAWCEDRYGQAGLAPAYARKAIIVLEEIPLEKFGNRIPQVNVEAVKTKVASYPFETIPAETTSTAARFGFNSAGTWMLNFDASVAAGDWWEPASRTFIGQDDGAPILGTATEASLSPDGTAWFYGVSTALGVIGGELYLFSRPPLGPFSYTAVANRPSVFTGVTRALATRTALAIYGSYASAAGYIVGALHAPHAQSGRDFCVDGNGDVAVVLHPTGSSSSFTIECANGTFTVAGLAAARSGPETAYICHVDEYSHFLVVSDGYFYFVDDSDGSVKSSGVVWGGLGGAVLQYNNAQQNPFLSELWGIESANVVKRSLEDASILASYPKSNWTSSASSLNWAYDPLNHALWTRSVDNFIRILYLDRVSSDGVTLGEVLTDVADWVGVKNKSFAALDQLIPGWLVSPGTTRNMVEPLLTLHDSDVRSRGFMLEGQKRGSSPAGSALLTKDFASDGEAPRFKIQIAPDSSLPLRLTVNFADSDKDQQNNNVVCGRAADAVKSKRTPSIDMGTYVGTPDAIRPLGDRALRRLWRDREEISFAVTAQEIAMTPGDVRPFVCDTLERVGRLERMVLTGRGGSLIRCEFKRDHPSVATLSNGVGSELFGRDTDTIYTLGTTKGVMLDVPLLADTHEITVPQLYFGATRYVATANWPGAIAWKLDAVGTDFEAWARLDSTEEIVCGYASTALADANPRLWDRGNSVNVILYAGATLSNASEAAINADRSLNLAALKCADGTVELFNFTTATLEADGSYTLTGLKRGRKGTEAAMAGHASGDEFVLLSGLSRGAMGLSDVGATETFRIATIGMDPTASAPIVFSPYSGASLKPRPVCQPYARRDQATGDWNFRWIRRTRVGGAWVGGSPIPLSENREAYEVAIPTSAGGTRILSVTDPEATWTSAQQTTDYGAPQTGLPAGIRVYQLSDAVGRGFASPEPLAA